MSRPHRAPDGGLCNLLKGGWHGQVRTHNTVAWEGIGRTCPTPESPGHFDCFTCGATHLPGTESEAQRHAQRCRPPQ